MDTQLDLWPQLGISAPNQSASPEQIILSADGEIILYTQVFDTTDCTRLFTELYTASHWRQDMIHMYGRQLPIPRRVCFLCGRDGRKQGGLVAGTTESIAWPRAVP